MSSSKRLSIHNPRCRKRRQSPHNNSRQSGSSTVSYIAIVKNINTNFSYRALFQIPNYGAMRPSSTELVSSQASTTQTTSIALPPHESVGTQPDQAPDATVISPSPSLPISPRRLICPVLVPKKRKHKSPTLPPPSKKTK